MHISRSLSLFALGAGIAVIATTALRPGTPAALAQQAQQAQQQQQVQQPQGQQNPQQMQQPQQQNQQEQQQDIAFIGNGRLLSNIVKVGNTLYMSGVLGTSGERGIAPETRAAMERMKTLLEANGSHMDDIVKCTVFLADFTEWSAMNEVYLSYFPTHRPARSAIAVSGLASNARVEVECIAVIGARNAENR